jgi:hypothetical protein
MYLPRQHRQGSPRTSWLPAEPVSGSGKIGPRCVREATGKGPLPQRDEVKMIESCVRAGSRAIELNALQR